MIIISELQAPVIDLPASGQVVMGGFQSGNSRLSSVEVFPRPPSETCFIPDLPQPREHHSISLLSGGRLVVCGGNFHSQGYSLNSCISWAAGNITWTPMHTMRCVLFHILQRKCEMHCTAAYQKTCQRQKL